MISNLILNNTKKEEFYKSVVCRTIPIKECRSYIDCTECFKKHMINIPKEGKKVKKNHVDFIRENRLLLTNPKETFVGFIQKNNENYIDGIECDIEPLVFLNKDSYTYDSNYLREGDILKVGCTWKNFKKIIIDKFSEMNCNFKDAVVALDTGNLIYFNKTGDVINVSGNQIISPNALVIKLFLEDEPNMEIKKYTELENNGVKIFSIKKFEKFNPVEITNDNRYKIANEAYEFFVYNPFDFNEDNRRS